MEYGVRVRIVFDHVGRGRNEKGTAHAGFAVCLGDVLMAAGADRSIHIVRMGNLSHPL